MVPITVMSPSVCIAQLDMACSPPCPPPITDQSPAEGQTNVVLLVTSPLIATPLPDLLPIVTPAPALKSIMLLVSFASIKQPEKSTIELF